MDLTGETAFTLALLRDTRAWRQRLVEELSLSSRHHVRIVSSYQIDLPPNLLSEFDLAGRRRSPDSAQVIVPLGTRVKRPLLAFDVQGPNGSSAALHPRAAIARVQAEYVIELMATSPGDRNQITAGLPFELVEAICRFTPGNYLRVAPRRTSVHERHARYLERELGFTVTPGDVEILSILTRDVPKSLCAALQEQPSPVSSSEVVVLALPLLNPKPQSLDEVKSLLIRYADAVAALTEAQDEILLETLAEYGRRWEVLIECEIGLTSPSTVKLSEDRELRIGVGGWTRHRFTMGDAASGHLYVRCQDPAVELASYRLLDPRGMLLADSRKGNCSSALEGVRDTTDSLAVYSSVGDRPYYIDALLRLRPAVALSASSLFVGLVLITAVAAVGLADETSEDFVDRIAVFTLPATFAVAIVFIREQTTLALRLQRTSRAGLLVLVTILWSVVLYQLVGVPWHALFSWLTRWYSAG